MKQLLELAMLLYPAAWRRRYGAELSFLLEDAHSGWRDLFDVVKGGLRARLTAQLKLPYFVQGEIMRLLNPFPTRKIVTALAAVSMLLVAGWYLLPQAEFQADTLILIDPAKVSESQHLPLTELDARGRLNMIDQMLMSSTRLQRVIDTYDLYKNLKGRKRQEEIIQKMRSDITVELAPNPYEKTDGALRAFRIAYRYPNASIVAQVTNQLASLFIEENLKIREQFVEGNLEFLDKRLESLRQQLTQAEARLHAAKSDEERSVQGRDLTLLRDYYSKLFTQSLELTTDAYAEKWQKSERFTILDPARIPETPARLRPRFMTAGW
jgi:hypothetical protein